MTTTNLSNYIDTLYYYVEKNTKAEIPVTAYADAIEKAQSLLGLTVQQLCEISGASSGCVARWGQGRAAPAPKMRKYMFRQLFTRATRF